MQDTPLGVYPEREGYGAAFRRDRHLLPMAACIRSRPTPRMLDFPVSTFVRSGSHHGRLRIVGRPQGRTVPGGGRQHAERRLAAIEGKRLSTPVAAVTRPQTGVSVRTRYGIDGVDSAALACHSDPAPARLQDAAEEPDARLPVPGGLMRLLRRRGAAHRRAEQRRAVPPGSRHQDHQDFGAAGSGRGRTGIGMLHSSTLSGE